MGVGFCGVDPDKDLGRWSKDVMRISKMSFVLQMDKKVFTVKNGFGMRVTKKGFEVGSKKVLDLEGVSDRSFLLKLRSGFGGRGRVWGWGWVRVYAPHICSKYYQVINLYFCTTFLFLKIRP